MAYFRLKAYDADVWMPSFMGLMQGGDGVNVDPRYAVEVENLETPYGVLQPQAEPILMEGGFETKIETMARLYRRWYDGTGSNEWLVIATAGKLFYKQVNSSGSWTQLPFPSGVTAYSCNVWSWVTYEINPDGGDPVDVLLLSNAQDGMIMVVPPYTATTSQLDWAVQTVDTNGKKFGVIERYAERIWGGALAEDPDMLMYSAPFDPTDWEINTTTPEDGAGDISQPSWDGDSFTALKAFGSQLIAFKQHRVWRVMGTDPGEFTFKEQYGGGTPYYNTVSVYMEQIFMAERLGLSVYDGLSVANFKRENVEKFWNTVNKNAMDQMCGVIFQNRYYLAVPTGSSTVNDTLLVYDLRDQTFLVYTDMYIESFLVTDEILYATSSKLPGKILTIPHDSWATNNATGKRTKWVSPWMDFNYKTINKGGYEVYFCPEVRKYPVTFRISIQTEKKTKSKNITIQPTTVKAKQKRVRFGGAGRRFRIIIETLTIPKGATWRLTGGLQMVVETDPD